LNDAVRPGDVVARYGGEEFAIIFPETGESSALAMAERVRKSVEAHAFMGSAGGAFNLTVSIGCASRLAGAGTPNDLIQASDAALYRAKKAGRNRVVVADEASPANGIGWGTAA
jgi:diguanylate cyclase (GGDEF)-like protein